MTADYHTAQGDFSSIISGLTPMALTNFVMWLDIKVAEFKIYGQMLLDEEDPNVTKWFLRSGYFPDMMTNPKDKNLQWGRRSRHERHKRPITATGIKYQDTDASPSKHQKESHSSEPEIIHLESETILPVVTTSATECNHLQSTYINSSQHSNISSQLQNMKAKIPETIQLNDDNPIQESCRNIGTAILTTHEDNVSLPCNLLESKTNLLESSDTFNITSHPKHSHVQQFSPSHPEVPVSYSEPSQDSTLTENSVSKLPHQDCPETKPKERDLILKVEPVDEGYDGVEITGNKINKSEYQELPCMDNSLSRTLEGNTTNYGSYGHIIEKDSIMYLDDSSLPDVSDSVHIQSKNSIWQEPLVSWKKQTKFYEEMKSESNLDSSPSVSSSGSHRSALTTCTTKKPNYIDATAGEPITLNSDSEVEDDLMSGFEENDIYSQTYQEVSASVERMFFCNFCQYQTNSDWNMKLHIDGSHLESIQSKVFCEKCGTSFKHRSSLQRHNREHHLENRPAVQMFVCQICPYRTFRASNLRRHNSTKHYKM